MGPHLRPFAGPAGSCWRDFSGQPLVRRGGPVSLRAGVPWRDLPERFGAWKNAHTRFSRWSKAGVWNKVFTHLSADADNEYAMIDSTIVRAHQHSAGAKKKLARIRLSGVRVAD